MTTRSELAPAAVPALRVGDVVRLADAAGCSLHAGRVVDLRGAQIHVAVLPEGRTTLRYSAATRRLLGARTVLVVAPADELDWLAAFQCLGATVTA